MSNRNGHPDYSYKLFGYHFLLAQLAEPGQTDRARHRLIAAAGVIVLDAAVVVRVAGVGGVPRGVLVMGAVATVRWPVPESGTHDGQCGG